MFISAVLALLPVWGLKVVPILLVLFMGFTMTMHFLPGGYLGSLMFVILVCLAGATSHFIEHEGLWHEPGNVTINS